MTWMLPQLDEKIEDLNNSYLQMSSDYQSLYICIFNYIVHSETMKPRTYISS